MIFLKLRRMAYLLALSVLPFTGSAQQKQTLFYKSGQKFMEGQWMYAPEAYDNAHHFLLEEASYQDAFDITQVEYLVGSNGKLPLIFEGALQVWHKNGTLAYDWFFRNGALNGPAKRYDTAGRTLYEGHYTNGMPDGNWKVYHGNGQLSWTGRFEAYSQQELALDYRKRKSVFALEHLRNVHMYVFYGKRMELEKLEQDSIEPVWHMYEQLLMLNTKWNGTYTFYGLSGKKEAELSYRDNRRDGVWTLYLDDGRLLSALRYQSGALVGSRYDIHWPLVSLRNDMPAVLLRGERVTPLDPNMPGFPGGDSAFNDFFRDKYDSEAVLVSSEKGSDWTVIDPQQISFVIAEDGSVHNVRVVGTEMSKDDFRLAAAIAQMPNWVWPLGAGLPGSGLLGSGGKSVSMHLLEVHKRWIRFAQ